jgi:hypothetical protein
MANVLKGNPLVVDTAESGIYEGNRFIKRVVWKGPTTIGHTLVIKSVNPTATPVFIVDAVCEVALQSQVFLIEQAFEGLTVTTIASGTAYIYFVV